MSNSAPEDEPDHDDRNEDGSLGRQPTRPSRHETLDTVSRHASYPDTAEKKSSLLERAKAIWAKTGIDKRTYMSMFKGALAPTVSLALYQSNAFSSFYTTLGYLVIIMTILPVVIMPRAKFLQTMLINTLFVCLGSAVALLAMFCCVKARGNEGPGSGGPGTSGTPAHGASTATYNSSASAVAGLWLFVEIYSISVIRGKNPQYTIPLPREMLIPLLGIMWAVLANVSMTYGPQFSTITQAESFVYRLLTAFLTGFGVAFVISLLVFPLNSRQVVFKEMTGYISSLRASLAANLEYMHSLEDTDMFAAQRTNTAGEKPPRSPQAEKVKGKMQGLTALHGKIAADLPFAKREVALGKLGPDDIQECFRLLRLIAVPTVGLGSISDIFDRIAEDRGWDRSVNYANVDLDDTEKVPESEKMRIEAVNEWHELMRILREPFDTITSVIDGGLEHILLILQLIPRPKPTSKMDDGESGMSSEPKPGEQGYITYFEKQTRDFLDSKKATLRGWAHVHGIDLPQDYFENPESQDFEAPAWMHEGILSETHAKLRRQLFLCLYIEYLLFTIARRTQHLMVAAEGYQHNGKLSKTRLVVPGFKRGRKWLMSLFNDSDSPHDSDITDGRSNTVYLGDAYKKRKDPEHLPPQNAWEHFGNQLRKIAHFFRSPASSFGFRVACATMTIAVVNYLRDTQTFFTTQRLFWAQIMVSISMSPTAGQSLRNFFLRIFGTFCALVFSWIAWYIVDGNTAGAIVFFFVFIHVGVYILLKYPQYTPVGMIGQVTMALIIGYELQVRKIGVRVATSNGQAYYPIYELGPIRLATVCAGLFVAWIWTVFPYPISEHNQIRKSLGGSLYLLANYYSVTRETVRLRLRNEQGDMTLPDSPGRKLEKARTKLYSKANLTIAGLRSQSGFLKFDIPVGGKFPREQYQGIILRLQSILNFMSLVSLASESFAVLRQPGEAGHGSTWLADFQKLVVQVNLASEQVTTLLALMSASVSGGQPLPPYLGVPEPFLLGQKLEEMDQDVLSVRHIAEPGFASFAVMQIGTKFIHDDLRALVAAVKELVGELDFSYHIVSTNDPDRDGSEDEPLFSKTESNSTSRSKQD